MQTDPDLSDAIRRFERQYAENPDSLVFARLADLYRKAGSPESALEVLAEGLERHPDYLSAHIVRARCLRGLDRLREAEDAFLHVLELDSENLVALRSLAEMAWERGDGETARERLDELLELDPRNEEALELMDAVRGGESPGGAKSAGGTEEGFAGAEEGSAGGGEGFVAEDDPFGLPPMPSGGTSRRAEPDGPETAPPGEEPQAAPPGEEPQAAPAPDGEPRGGRAFEVEPAEPTEPAEPVGEEASEPAAEAGPAPSAGVPDEDEGERWWEISRSDREAADEAAEGAAPESERAREEEAQPAVGPASEAEELRAQIEELRVQAEQETDLSDAEEDLATETLANLYEAQGFYREAVEMYEELVAQRPEDEDLRRRLERAREALGETAGEAATAAASGPTEAAAASPGNQDASPAGAAEAAGSANPRKEAVTAAGELRAVLRGEASPERRDAGGS